MSRIQIYTTRWCGYCVRAKALLDGKGIGGYTGPWRLEKSGSLDERLAA